MKLLIIMDIILMNLRNNGQSLKSKTKVIFTPLLDRTPSDPSTVFTAMTEAEKITSQAGQNITIFTTDQQLYRVALEVMWMEPIAFKISMHWIMSFVESIGVLMKNSGLLPLPKTCFEGVEKMLTGGNSLRT